MAPVVEVLKDLVDLLRLYRQQIADGNQQIRMWLKQLKEIENQRGNPCDSAPNFVMVNGGVPKQNDHAGSVEVQSSRRTMQFQPNVEVLTFKGPKVDPTSMYLQGKARSWLDRFLLGRPHTDLDDVIANWCAGSRDEAGNQLEATVRTDALQVLNESPK